MKKVLAWCLVLLLSTVSVPVWADELMDITRAAGYEVSEVNRPKSSIIIDGNTGAVLWQDNPDKVRDPASMSKVMTLYLVYEAIGQGKLTEDTVITATETDQAIAGIYEISNNKIIAGVDYTVEELITMTAVPSSNAATVMLANYLSNNDPDLFLDMMNAKAQELGMKNTYWYNASGASASSFQGYYNPTRYDHDAANQTTARDLSILVYHFLKNYPGILEHTKHPVVTVKAGTPYEETFETYNYSLPGARYGIEGVDGLKTGSSPRGAFNYIATAKRGDQRLISLIMGVGDWSDQDGEYYRHPFGNALLEKAYADYEYRKVLDAGKQLINGKNYELASDFYATIRKGQTPTYTIENDQLRVDNGLETVSPMISDGMTVEDVSGIKMAQKQLNEKVTLGELLKKPWIWGVGVFLLVATLLVWILSISHKEQNQRLMRDETGYRPRRSRRRRK
ncbi:D-alanyl-D-alanine carboxypeptidase family protein [Streptococcus sp. ZJ93]|uniref:D-alanyl-D-alanine carboxypeptidase family protein n=1 Tax=Streptococcus handemini TaxID=3161188 RepID=UPI0032EE5912